jgi:hypothetical protein
MSTVPPPRGGRDRARGRLTLLVAVAAMVAAAMGLVLDGVYGDDEATVQMLRGFDAVTLVVVGPLLLLVLRGDRQGPGNGRILLASLLTYLGYTYVYYVLGAGITDMFLLHVPLLSATVVALGLTLSGLGSDDHAHARRSVGEAHRVPAAVLALLAVALGGMWVYACAAYAIDGTWPVGSSLVESEAVVHLGIALDLSVLVPLYGTAAVLLWRRHAWGFVLAALALVAGTLHQVSYVVALLFQYRAEVPGSVAVDPFEPVILGLYVVATAMLLRPLRSREPTPRHPPGTPAEGGAHA